MARSLPWPLSTASSFPRPPDMFDREWEWNELTAFATGEGTGPRLGAVSGRRSRGTSHATPACYSGAGFTPELRAAADRGEVLLVDLERLYGGS
ncbi:hypothetical protein ACFYQA_23605 [Streptomyces sp. NPDC005774]|uniref:hypothetical protein n=1 Tax=Streptomyces sp. NPDC005774 TaxID=3364728 RepID=UPI00369C4598